jgi:hypothetical protein
MHIARKINANIESRFVAYAPADDSFTLPGNIQG